MRWRGPDDGPRRWLVDTKEPNLVTVTADRCWVEPNGDLVLADDDPDDEERWILVLAFAKGVWATCGQEPIPDV